VLPYVLLGSGLAFAAVIQPGPLQAFLMSRVAAAGWRRTLPASLAPLISDGPIAVLAVVVLGHMPRAAQEGLRGAGGLLLLYLAWVAYRQWRTPAVAETTGSTPRTLLQAVLVNLLNPHPYLGWTLILGPTVVTAWSEHPSHAVALVVAFYGTLVASLAAFIALVGTASLLGPRGQRILVGLSAVVLAGLAVYLLAVSIWGLTHPAIAANGSPIG
jgi:threonine/homoserine/homoserine lactone efflux protein